MTKKNHFGFTLVELLVVITIIALLTLMGMVSYQGATRKGRDGRRTADMEQIRSALEIFRSDSVTNEYPDLLGELAPTYIQELPVDPKDHLYVYEPVDGGTGKRAYNLCAHLETKESLTTDGCGGTEACGTDGSLDNKCNYEVKNP